METNECRKYIVVVYDPTDDKNYSLTMNDIIHRDDTFSYGGHQVIVTMVIDRDTHLEI